MKPASRLLAILFLCGLLPCRADSHPNARFYRGDVTRSTSWNGVIRVTGKLVVREGVTVTVEPGTEVLVQPGTGNDIEIRGRLFVRGIPGRPVLFDSAGGCAAGPWGGIRFLPGGVGVLEHARFRCSGTGIRGDLSGVTRTGVAIEPAR